MGIIAEKPSVETSGKRGERRQGRYVPVHRKHAVSRNQRPFFAAAMRVQYLLDVAHIAMPVEMVLCAAQFGAGVNAGMRQFIDEDQIVRADHGRYDAGIGEIAGAKHAGRLAAFNSRQPQFKVLVERMIAGNQAGSTGAEAIVFDGIDCRRDDLWMLTEIEIVVAGERQQTTAVTLDPKSRARRDHGRAAKLRAFQALKFVAGKSIKRMHSQRSRFLFDRHDRSISGTAQPAVKAKHKTRAAHCEPLMLRPKWRSTPAP